MNKKIIFLLFVPLISLASPCDNAPLLTVLPPSSMKFAPSDYCRKVEKHTYPCVKFTFPNIDSVHKLRLHCEVKIRDAFSVGIFIGKNYTAYSGLKDGDWLAIPSSGVAQADFEGCMDPGQDNHVIFWSGGNDGEATCKSG